MTYDDTTLDERRSADDIVEDSWPYDGPHGDEVTVSAAIAIERLVRYLNNATQSAGGAPYAATVGSVVAAVRTSIAGQRQLLDQLADRLRAVADDPALYDWIDHNASARDAALRAAEALSAAQTARADYEAALNTASELAGRLSGSSSE